MNGRDIAKLDSRTVFWTILSETFRNAFFYGIGMFVIIAIGSFLHWLAVGLFALYALVVGASILHSVVTTGTGIVFSVANLPKVFREGSVAVRDQFYLSGANVIQIIETILLIIFTFAIYRNLFPE